MSAAKPSMNTAHPFHQSLINLLLQDTGASSALQEALKKQGDINSSQIRRLNKLVADCVAKTLTPEFYKNFSEKKSLHEEKELTRKIKLLSAKPQSSSKRSPATIAAAYPSPLFKPNDDEDLNVSDFQLTLDTSKLLVTGAVSAPLTITASASNPKKIIGFNTF